MEDTIYKTPESELEVKGSHDGVELWNPDAAGAWSILFTPVFGSILVRKNWQALGDSKKAKTGSIWLLVSVFILIASIFIPISGFVFLIIWYFAYQKPQTSFVKSQVGTYTKKGWLKPLGIAVACVVVFYILVVLVLLIGA